MRIVVVGPGAIGCLLSALLAESGEDVILLDKRSARARLISHNGIRLDEGARSRRVSVRAVSDAARIKRADHVFLCVKSYDTAAAVRHARLLVGPDTTLCSFQNGLGNAEIITRAVRPGCAVCASTAHGATTIAPGHVVHAGAGVTMLAPCRGTAASRAEELAALLRRAGLHVRLTGDARSLIWSKLIINAAINPVTAIAGVANGAVLQRPDLRSLSARAAIEAERVARARGVTLLFRDAVAEVEAVCRRTRDNLSSMLQDILRGKRTEIDAINGAIVAEARQSGIPAPVNIRLVESVKTKERR
ncbi:MAG: 2-dehydropantoate 2-reductase [Verrucomicrobiota bacterium]|nr:2-dehydropantoate 2-reductase [Verrucomicrobiota bacterium]